MNIGESDHAFAILHGELQLEGVDIVPHLLITWFVIRIDQSMEIAHPLVTPICRLTFTAGGIGMTKTPSINRIITWKKTR